jgi:hypothetical protein
MSNLSIRETRPLLLLGCFRHLCQSQLDEFLFAGLPLTPASRDVITRRILRRLLSRKLIAALPRPSAEPGGRSARLVYVLTRAGYSVAASLNPSLPAWRPIDRSTFLISHSLVTADLALAFHRAARSNAGHEVLDWEGDWQTAIRLGASLIVPDGHLVYATAGCQIEAFIETDLGTEGTRFFAQKISRYLELYRSGRWRGRVATWPVVLTVTTTEGRANILRRATESVLSAQRDAERITKLTEFRFSALGDVLGPAGPLGAIWQVAGRPERRSLLPEFPGG